VTLPWIVAFVALWAFALLCGLALLGVLRRALPLLELAERQLASAAQNARRPIGLEVGATVPAFDAEEIGGGRFTDADLRLSPTAVLFLDASCEGCQRLFDDLAGGHVPEVGVRLVVVSNDPEEARSLKNAGVPVLIQQDRSIAKLFEAEFTPQAFLVATDGRVLASGLPNDWGQLQEIIARAEGREVVVELTSGP
jgi:AhpC/TSA family